MLLAAMLITATLAPETPGVPYRQPHLAVGNGMVGVTFGAGNAVYFAGSRDEGRSFSRPVRVAEAPILSLGHRRGPRIAISGSAIVISAVTATKPRGGDGELTAWRSSDGGKTWSSGVAINDAPAAAREGLHAMASGQGLVFAVWLDLRSRGTRLYGAASRDGGAAWSKNLQIYESPEGKICECCHPSVAVDDQGAIYVMWRNWLGGARDMYWSRSTDDGKTFSTAEKLGAGSWPLNACPMDGGGVAFEAGGGLVTAWRRAGEVFLARGGGAETRLDAGKDPVIAVGRGGVYAAWAHGHGLRARIPGREEPVALAERGAFAHLAALPQGAVLAAWESDGAIVFSRVD